MAAPRPHLAPAARRLAATLLLAGCGRGAPTAADGALPPAFAARTDGPYVAGTVVAREDGIGEFARVRVRASPGAAAAARAEAFITVHPDSLLQWRDGRAAHPADLRVGRAVTVWVQGAELRSLPPQAAGSAILVER